jgi:DNA-binding CsgD family transcriptional regulator
MADRLDAGREAFARRAWVGAYEGLSAPSAEGLEGVDFERRAVAAYLVGRDDESAAAWEAAHRWHAEAGDVAEAARCSFWLALCLLLRGRTAQAGGWLGRTEGIIKGAGLDCAAGGYVLIPGALGALAAGDAATARDLAVRATEIGDRFGDADLLALGTLAQGQALIAQGDTTAGVARLDEVMVSVTSGEVGPITSGIVYCAVILECMRLFDFSRASEWTAALSAWCDAQPDLVAFRGQCLVHRSQLQQVAGDWPEAITTAALACQRLTDPPHPALGLAHYQEAELHRLLGAFDEAEAAYRQANRSGYPPMPGLALLELARGDAEAAVATIRSALVEAREPLERPALLAAAVDIFRAAGDAAGVRKAADELAEIAAGCVSEVLDAMADQATGTAVLGEGDPSGALRHLRAAAAGWQHLGMPYEVARTAVVVGLSCAALGDSTSAALEFDRARDILTELAARPDLERLTSLTAGLVPRTTDQRRARGAGGLSAREREVLALVAAGKSNREIAAELVISQHTAARHVENIFTKLGVTSRAAATAYAYQHDLL